jgi:hypothetical protein
MQSFGYKGKNAAASFVTDLRRKKVPANVYNPGDIKTRGDTPITDVKQFQTTLNVYSQITGSPLGEGSEPAPLPPLTFSPVQAFGTGGQGNAVAYGGGVWVAVGESGDGSDRNIYISSDHGNTWTAKTAFGAGGQGNAVAYDGIGRWIAVGTGGIWTSINNGDSWQLNSELIRGISVAYANGVWVVVGVSVNYDGNNILISTNNCESWIPKSAFGTGAGNGQAVAYGGGVWVAVGQNADIPGDNIYISDDGGENWNQKSAFGEGSGQAVAWGPSTTGNPSGVWVAVGNNGDGTSTNDIYISDDGGENWTGKSAFGADGGGVSVAYGNGVWVAGGENDTDFQNVYSSIDNGDTWIPSLDIPGGVQGVAYGNGQWVAVGPAILNTIHTSQDGKNWTGQFAFGLVGGGIAVAYGADGVWVAVGEDGTGETAGPNNIFVGTT